MASEQLVADLSDFHTVDLITTGRRTGRTARVEIWWFHVDGRFVITGTPGKRDWYANILSDPRVVIQSPIGDFPAHARTISDATFRRRVFTDPDIGWYRTQADLEELVADAPMVEVLLD